MIAYKPPPGILYSLVLIGAGVGVIWIYGPPLVSYFTTDELIFPIVRNVGWRNADVVTSWNTEPLTADFLALTCAVMIALGAIGLLCGMRGLWRNFREG
jgi:hypothetical protein